MTRATGAQAIPVIIACEGLDTARLHRKPQTAWDKNAALIADSTPQDRP